MDTENQKPRDSGDFSPSPCSALVWAYDPATVPKSALQSTHREPCPFCGAQASGLTHQNKHVVVMCGNCGAYGPELLDESDNWNENDYRAILLWNHRGKWPSEPNIQDEGQPEDGR
jgi:hypothetical protein